MQRVFILFLYFFHSIISAFYLSSLFNAGQISGWSREPWNVVGKTSADFFFFVYWTCWQRNWHLRLCCIGHTSCSTEHLRTKVYRADFFLLSIKLKPNPTLPNFSFAGAPGDYNYRLGNRLEEVTFHWFLFDISQTNYIYVASNGLLVGRLLVRF